MIYIPLNEICEQITFKWLGTSMYYSPVRAIHSHHWLMSTYIAQCASTQESSLPDSASQVFPSGRRGIGTPVGARSSDQEFDPLTTS